MSTNQNGDVRPPDLNAAEEAVPEVADFRAVLRAFQLDQTATVQAL